MDPISAPRSGPCVYPCLAAGSGCSRQLSRTNCLVMDVFNDAQHPSTRHEVLQAITVSNTSFSQARRLRHWIEQLVAITVCKGPHAAVRLKQDRETGERSFKPAIQRLSLQGVLHHRRYQREHEAAATLLGMPSGTAPCAGAGIRQLKEREKELLYELYRAEKTLASMKAHEG